ncbi:MAG TPA: SAM-dependent methyltransferase [Bacteroidia bacterium]|jgi:SAM-dependent MidA family methyltransferase|nr:SAM-dependent methyltransferase [Bacteroidia bacterium]
MGNALIETSALTLSETIKEKIFKEGNISFREFMEMALYHPEMGYYTSEGNKIGTQGDYYTSPDITPILGEMIGKQLEEMWIILDKKPFSVVEYGAGDGSLCKDILLYLKNNTEFYNDLTYYIIEKSPAALEKEKRLLTEKVQWIDSLGSVAPINGCILSNEVLDNFSVHRVVMKEDLMEVYTGYEDGFFEVLKQAPKPLKEYFEELNVLLPYGFCTEVNLEALSWLNDIANGLQKGFVLTIDYGYPSHELYRYDRRAGTLVCYSRHRLHDNLYSNIGNQDITTHVNFSALCHWGLKYGLDYCGFIHQSYFLLALGLNEYLRKTEEKEHSDYLNDEQKAFFINTFMVDIGNKLKVLIQQKGLPPQKLLGLKFMFKKLY